MLFERGIGGSPQAVWLARTPEANQLLALPSASRGVLEARVLETHGNAATLEVSGQRVQAKSHVPLQVGDRLWVRVEQQADQTIRLAIQASGPESGATPSLSTTALEEQLREVGLPLDARMRLIARALIARDGVLERQAALRLADALRVFSQLTAQEVGAAALLQRAGVPLSPAAMVQAAIRADATAPLQVGAALQAVWADIHRLAARSDGATTLLAQQLIDALGALSRASNSAEALRSLQAWVDALIPPGALTRGHGGSPVPSPLLGNTPQTTSLPDKPDGDSFPAVSVSQPGDAPARINYVNPVVNRGPDLAGLLAGLARLLGGNQSALKQRLNEAVAEIRTLQLSHSDAGTSALRQEAALVPLFLPGLGGAHQASWIEIHPPRDEAGTGPSDASRRLTLVLETEFLGTLHVDVSVSQGTVHLAFGVPDARNRAFVAGHVEELREALSQIGLQVGTLATRPASSVPRATGANPVLADAVQFDRRI